MIARVHNEVLVCDGCSDGVVRFRLVGPGTVFEKACPHVEMVFLEWHRDLRDKEGPRIKDVWQPFCIGLMLGASIAACLFPWGSV